MKPMTPTKSERVLRGGDERENVMEGGNERES